MTMKLRIGLALAAAVTPLTPSLAADYDPPIYVDQAPEYKPVEVGSGWYLRGDVSYAVNKPFKDTSFGVDPANYNEVFDERYMPASASLGMGYHFNDYLRAELNFGIMPYEKSTQTANFAGVVGPPAVSGWTASASTDNRMYTGMLNAYADLGTYMGFTPYIGAGAGLVYNKRVANWSTDYADPAMTDVSVNDSRRQYTWAYSLNAGVAYNLTQNVALDIGYQYFSAPDAEYAVPSHQYTDAGGPAGASIKKGIDYHQIKVGLRYDLW